MKWDAELSPRCEIWTMRKRRGVAMPRVLVVDDFRDTADAICCVLSLFDIDTSVAYGGESALRKARDWQPDVALLDIWMPDISGLDVSQQIRKSAHLADTILIAHSAAAESADRERAKSAAFDAFCAKPTDAERLVPLVRYFVREST
ncbi:response regulator [Caballeronia sp. LZ001]|uniref:response regulator n=1 Tax=Caballeronia sp. LZ001 TaxID=3038553 RepID=UPI002864ED46|nr:response regulator [Caballeronia sp. LZ001]MDR5806438.1 response regulator [Caballeronia sp. LZ001]